MEETVMGVLGLVTGTMAWGIDNAFALAVGAVLGSTLFRAALGLVSDVLGRGKGLVDDVTTAVAGKK